MADTYLRDVDFEESVIVGDTLLLNFTIVDAVEAPYDLTDCVVWFTIKNDYLDLDADAVLQESVAVHDDAVNGLSSMKVVVPADSELGKKYYDCQVVNNAGDKFTFKRGRVTLGYEVTKA